MTAIIDFLTGIADGVVAAIDFLQGLIEDLLYVAQTLAVVLVEMPTYLSFLPSEILASILALLSIVVIYKILGRD